MIKKEITMDNGEKYLVGFKEIGSQKDGIECHVLEKGIIGHRSVYNELYLKGLMPNYYNMAVWTIIDYQNECKQKQILIEESWV
jgi:hypothetical protein